MDNPQRGFPSPRSLDRVMTVDFIADKSNGAINDKLLHKMVAGLIGAEAAAKFMAFRQLQKIHPVVREMLTGKKPLQVPGNNQTKKMENFCNAVVANFWSAPTEQAIVFDTTYKILRALEPAAAFRLIQNIINGAPERAVEVFGHPKLGTLCRQFMEGIKSISEGDDAA
ncbi:MAG: hypothetical protein WCQ99_00385 [Pseudomonadota bacterium]